MFSTSGDVQYIGDAQYIGGYHEYIGGYHEYIGGYHDACGGMVFGDSHGINWPL